MSRAEAMEMLSHLKISEVLTLGQLDALDVAILALGDGWVSVEHGRPEEDAYCIVADDNTTMGTVRKYMNGSFWYATGIEHDLTITYIVDDSVKYFQPLPSPPNPKP